MPGPAVRLGALLYLGFSCSLAYGKWDEPASEEPIIMGALGDSITAGYNASRLGDNREFSWSTGTDPQVTSHLQRLQQIHGRPVTGFNEAVAGTKVAGLAPQVDRLIPRNPSYVTIAIGANDLCSWPADHQSSLEAFRQELDRQVTRLIEARPNLTIVLSPIPDLGNLREVAVTQSGCQMKWDFLGICRPLLGSQATEQDRAAFAQRWRDTNEAIAGVAGHHPEQVIYDPEAAETRFSWEHVSSIDCFHPSVAGQNLLSEKTWPTALETLP